MVSPEGRVFRRPGKRQALTSFLHHSDWHLRALTCSPAHGDAVGARGKVLPVRGAEAALSLADLFDGRSQLIVYHFMFGPDWEEGCKSCSFWADNFNGIPIHLNHRDVTFTAVSRAPLAKVKIKVRVPFSPSPNAYLKQDNG